MEDKGTLCFNMVAKNMIYRFMGKTGLKISVIGFGNWVNNVKETEEQEEATYQCMKVYFLIKYS